MFHARKSRRLRLTMLGVAVLAILTAGGAVAYAAIPDLNGLIHSCYHVNGQGQIDGSATLRVIDPAASNKDGKACKKDENALDWNQQGVQGPQGPQGVQGPQGAQGSQGPQGPPGPGVAGHVYVSNFNGHTIDSPGQEIVGLSGLPAGNYLVWSFLDIIGDDGGNDTDCVWKINGVTDNGSYGFFGQTFQYDGKDDSYGRTPMFGAVNLAGPSNTVTVNCGISNGNHPEVVGQMIALRVGDVN